MARINHTLLGLFRHQLWLEHLTILDESADDYGTLFVLEENFIISQSLSNLMEVTNFAVIQLYFEGNAKLCLRVMHDD